MLCISLWSGMCIKWKTQLSAIHPFLEIFRNISLRVINPSASNETIPESKFVWVSRDPADPSDRILPKAFETPNSPFISFLIDKKWVLLWGDADRDPRPIVEICTFTYPPDKYVVPQLARAFQDGLRTNKLPSKHIDDPGSLRIVSVYRVHQRTSARVWIPCIKTRTVLRLVNISELEHRQPVNTSGSW